MYRNEALSLRLSRRAGSKHDAVLRGIPNHYAGLDWRGPYSRLPNSLNNPIQFVRASQHDRKVVQSKQIGWGGKAPSPAQVLNLN